MYKEESVSRLAGREIRESPAGQKKEQDEEMPKEREGTAASSGGEVSFVAPAIWNTMEEQSATAHGTPAFRRLMRQDDHK